MAFQNTPESMAGFRAQRMRRFRRRLTVPVILALFVLALFGSHASALVLQGQFTGRDPSRIIRCNGRYYVYITGANIPMRYSDDLIHWSNGQSVLAASDSVNGVPQWARDASPGNTGNVVWAPDIIYFDGLYHLYWSFSTWGTSDSVIGLSTSPTLDPRDPNYKWTDRGPVIASRASDWGRVPNCIDPSPVFDAAGNLWLAHGSYGYGIGLTRLDNATGLRLSPTSTIYRLASGGIEASCIVYRDGYYYLFFNRGSCCQGANSTYHILVGRSTSITGPYRDRNGVNLVNGGSDGGGTLFLATNGSKIGPGHMGLYSDGTIDRFTYHLESDGSNFGRSTINVQTLLWGADGWPAAGSDLPNGTYRVVSKSSGLAMGVHGGSTADAAPIDQDVYNGTGFQQWTVAATPGGTPQTGYDGYYRLTSVGSGKVVDLLNCNPANGTAIDQYPWFNNNCQRWLIEQTSDGYYRIVSRGGGGVISVPEGSGAGSLLNEWAWDGSDRQKWSIAAIAPPPALSIDDVAQSEGDSGQSVLTFTVSLAQPSATPVTVQYRTLDDQAATTDSDYVGVPLTALTIPAGALSATLDIQVNGDDRYEWDERFLVVLSNPVSATIGDAQGAGTIRNDDAPPTVSIGDVTLAEGESGATDFAFTITKAGSTSLPVTLFYETADGTATVADGDYVPLTQRSLTIGADETTAEVVVQVTGDTGTEADEHFTLNLFSPSEAVIADSQGFGTIVNDDLPPITMADAVNSLMAAAGFIPASPDDLSRLNVEDPGSPLIDLLDAVRLARKVAGLESNP